MKCHEAITKEQTTSGEYVKIWVCYCGTTGCLEQQTTFLTPKEEKCLYESINTFKGYDRLKEYEATI